MSANSSCFPQANSHWLPADDVEYPPVGQAMASLHSKMALPRVSEATAAFKKLTQILLEAGGLPDSGVGQHGQACTQLLSPGSLILVQGSKLLKRCAGGRGGEAGANGRVHCRTGSAGVPARLSLSPYHQHTCLSGCQCADCPQCRCASPHMNSLAGEVLRPGLPVQQPMHATLPLQLLTACACCCAGPLIRHMIGSLGALQPLLSLAGGSLRLLALQYLSLHRDTAKLGYITTSLMAGLVREGFCISEEAEGDGQEGELLLSRVLLSMPAVNIPGSHGSDNS